MQAQDFYQSLYVCSDQLAVNSKLIRPFSEHLPPVRSQRLLSLYPDPSCNLYRRKTWKNEACRVSAISQKRILCETSSKNERFRLKRPNSPRRLHKMIAPAAATTTSTSATTITSTITTATNIIYYRNGVAAQYSQFRGPWGIHVHVFACLENHSRHFQTSFGSPVFVTATFRVLPRTFANLGCLSYNASTT